MRCHHAYPRGHTRSRQSPSGPADQGQVHARLAYLFPSLHPDGFEDPDSGWPDALRRFAAEAWRRAESGELADEELYACDAQWSGLYARMFIHTEQETARRAEIALGKV
jgi:hypothetical protein